MPERAGDEHQLRRQPPERVVLEPEPLEARAPPALLFDFFPPSEVVGEVLEGIAAQGEPLEGWKEQRHDPGRREARGGRAKGGGGGRARGRDAGEVEGGDLPSLRLDPLPVAEVERLGGGLVAVVYLPAPVVPLRDEGGGRVSEQGQRERGTRQGPPPPPRHRLAPLPLRSLPGLCFLFPLLELLPL